MQNSFQVVLRRKFKKCRQHMANKTTAIINMRETFGRPGVLGRKRKILIEEFITQVSPL